MKHTGCRYHNQDTNYYCGAAAAMMVLSNIGVSYADLDQVDLYNSNHSHNAKPSGWATDPYGLRFTLVDRRPSGFLNTFVVHKPTTEAEGTRDIVYTLHRYGVPPAVLVYHCMHWIVVPGVQTDVEPVGGPGDYTVEGFWIHNPVYHAGSPPPPHSATDACGTGGSLGESNTFVTYADWQATYFTGCNYDHPSHLNQYISVCDPDVRNLELPRRRPIQFLADGQQLIKPEQAVEFNQLGIRDYALLENDLVKKALGNANPGRPLVVVRLDRPNEYYHLLPWETNDGITAFSKTDARFGLFQSLHLLERPMSSRIYLSKDAALKRLTGRRFELPDHRGELVFFPDAACISPVLVWQPCRESFSPHLPFYQVTIGGNTLFVRIDGEVFTHLTTTGSGV